MASHDRKTGCRGSGLPRLSKIVLWSALVLAAYTGGGATQRRSETELLREELRALEVRQRALELEVQELRKLIARSGPPPPSPTVTVIDIANAPFRGNHEAGLALLEFSDYECGFCGRHTRETLPLLDEYIRSGRLRYVVRSFPIESRHKLAFKAHEAAGCAAEQGKFWEMHDRLFTGAAALRVEAFSAHARGIGISEPAFQQCLTSARAAERVRQDIAAGRAAGVSATPTFFLGAMQPGEKMRVLRTIHGAKSAAVFKEAIEELLKSTTIAR